jgi:ribonucleoside-diphosphate reductase alpha chain
MQRVAETAHRSSFLAPAGLGAATDLVAGRPDAARFVDFKVIRRNGSVVGFEPGKIAIAMTKAFLAVNGGHGAASARVRELVDQLTQGVVGALMRNKPAGGTFHIEDIQDQVELALMRSGTRSRARTCSTARSARRSARRDRRSSPPPGSRPDRGSACSTRAWCDRSTRARCAR